MGRHSPTSLSKALLLLLSLVAVPACTRAEPPRTFRVEVVGVEPEVTLREIRQSWFFRYSATRLEGWKGEVVEGLDPELEPAHLRVRVGRLPLSEEVRRLARGLPVTLEEPLGVAGDRYPGEPLALAVRLPRSPADSESPGVDWLIAGTDPRSLEDLTARVLSGETRGRERSGHGLKLDYWLLRSPRLERTGRFRTTEAGLEIDPAADEDDFAERDAWFAGLRELSGHGVVLRVPAERVGDPKIRRLHRTLDDAVTHMARRVPLEIDEPVQVVLEEDHVRQGRYVGEIGEAVLDEAGVVHLVFDPKDEPAYRHALARALVRRLRDDLPPWIERGAALWLSQDWYGKPYSDWLPLFAAAGVLPTAQQLLSGEMQEDSSNLLWVPVAAHVIDSRPGETLADRLAGLPSRREIASRLAAVRPAAADPGRASPRQARPFLHGVSFAMSNGLEIGYHAPSAARRLDRLAGLGADAVSLMPFAYQPAPDVPELRYLRRSPSSETDVGMLHAARQAHRRGMTVLWKPQIWLSGGSWPGDVRMTTEEDWEAWWQSYRRFILHHAVLARWAEVEWFSVGVELGKTLDREREWRELIRGARLLFPGGLTYAANWHGDAEHAPFWPLLDALGVDAYYPLAGSAEADRETLREGAREARRRLENLATTHDRPVLLTEVGFAARRGAWVSPHEEGGELSLEDQRRAYEVLFGELGKPPWLAGVFVWKAFSGDRGRPGDRPDFRFLDRPAARVVEAYFERSARRALPAASGRP